MGGSFSESQLIELGFERNYVSAEESGDKEYVYYTLDFDDDNYTLSLISGCFEEGVEEVGVSFFEGNKSLTEEFILALKKEFGI